MPVSVERVDKNIATTTRYIDMGPSAIIAVVELA